MKAMSWHQVAVHVVVQEQEALGPSFLRAHPLTGETGTRRKSAAALHGRGGGKEAITDEVES